MSEALLLSAAQVAEFLSISRSQVYRLDSAGQLPRPVLRMGRLTRWSRLELEQWIADRCPPRREKAG